MGGTVRTNHRTNLAPISHIVAHPPNIAEQLAGDGVGIRCQRCGGEGMDYCIGSQSRCREPTLCLTCTRFDAKPLATDLSEGTDRNISWVRGWQI